MKIKKGDYCIAKQQGGKDYLFKALSDNDSKSVEAVWEKNCHIPTQRHTMTVELSDVVLNLGPNPYPGKVYGYDVGEVYRKRLDHSAFGDIHFFYKPSKDVLVDLKTSMDKVAAKLKKLGLSFLLNDVVYEIRPYVSGKYYGMYMKSKKDKVLDRIWLKPELGPATDYPYMWYHELGHRLHLRFCPSKQLNARWLKLFNTSIKVESVKKEKSAELLELLLSGEEAPSDFKGQLDEDDALAFKWIIRTITQVSGLNIKDLDLLFEADEKDEIKRVWPVRTLHRKELAPIVSEYATVNVRELIAECFAFYMVGKKLPEPIVKLLEKTISYAKANKDKGPDDE